MAKNTEDEDLSRTKSEDLARPSTSGTSIFANRATNAIGSLQSTIGKDATPKWYGGSWRGKSSPVAGVAKDSASAPSIIPSDNGSIRSLRSKSSRLLRTPSKASPIVPSMTLLNITSGQQDSEDAGETVNHAGTIEPTRDTDTKDKSTEPSTGKPLTTNDETINHEQALAIVSQDRPTPAAGWGGWWTKPQTGNDDITDAPASETALASAVTTAEPRVNTEPVPNAGEVIGTTHPATTVDPKPEDMKPAAAHAPQPQKSWFGLWSTSQLSSPEPVQAATFETSVPASEAKVDATVDEVPATGAAASRATASTLGAWSYWSKASIPTADISSSRPSSAQDKVAVAETDTNPSPVSVQILPAESNSSNDAIQPIINKVKQVKDRVATKQPALAKDTSVSESSPPPTKAADVLKEPAASPETATEGSKDSKNNKNLLLPDFDKTYKVEESQTYLQHLINMLYSQKPPAEQKHLSLSTTPPRIKKAVAIGVHGYFPIPLLQKVLGPPTGTSIRFATGAATAIESWAKAHGQACEIEKIALEGEGMVADRVDTLWKLLLPWIDQIRQADFIMVACHSQGVPVAVMLVAKLLQFGCVQPLTRIGICAMAGVNLGPFSSYQSRYIGGAAGQLFDFANANSTVSKAYTSALRAALAAGVRVLYTGSIDDQLVSLESAVFSTASHPYIGRAVYVDGRIHAPDFLTHLVGLSLKLRNLGVSDHGLVRELSASLAGSLYGGEGHARIYRDQAVYCLAVRHALETADLQVNPELRVDEYETPAANANPYVLPWAMRGLLEEEYVKRELGGETRELLRLFDGWRPANKMLKDVKFRLEAVRTML